MQKQRECPVCRKPISLTTKSCPNCGNWLGDVSEHTLEDSETVEVLDTPKVPSPDKIESDEKQKSEHQYAKVEGLLDVNNQTPCPHCKSFHPPKAKFCPVIGKPIVPPDPPIPQNPPWWRHWGIWPGVVGFLLVGVGICLALLIRSLTSDGNAPPLAAKEEFTPTLTLSNIQTPLLPTTPTPTQINTSIPLLPPATPQPTAIFNQSNTIEPSLDIGSTMISPIDGMILIYVPAGEFKMGSESGEINESPVHIVYLDSFWIDQTEVTNTMFSQFVNEIGYITQAEKDGWSWDYRDSKWYKTSGANWRHPDGPGSSIERLENHPVIRISWDDALAYCKWAGRRLPTEAEWEKAARGTDGMLYPWGDTSPSANLLNFDSNIETTTSVGSYPLGASPYGALDMAGNVWEWVADWYNEDYYSISPYENPVEQTTSSGRGMRGGSWVWGTKTIRVTYREWGYQDAGYWSTGFRCAE